MFGALAPMAIDKIIECLSINKTRYSLITTLVKSINFFVYFEKNSVKWC